MPFTKDDLRLAQMRTMHADEFREQGAAMVRALSSGDKRELLAKAGDLSIEGGASLLLAQAIGRVAADSLSAALPVKSAELAPLIAQKLDELVAMPVVEGKGHHGEKEALARECARDGAMAALTSPTLFRTERGADEPTGGRWTQRLAAIIPWSRG